MGEFYELKRRQVEAPKEKEHDADYWKHRAEESECRCLELSQALCVSMDTVSMLETTLKTIDKALSKLGIFGRKGGLDRLLKHGIEIELDRTKKPSVDFFEVEDDVPATEMLKKLTGVDIDLGLLTGVHVWPRFNGESVDEEDDEDD